VYLTEEGPPLDINEVPRPIPHDYKHPVTQQPLSARDLHYLANTVSQRKNTTVFIHEALSEAEQDKIRFSERMVIKASMMAMLLLILFVACEILSAPYAQEYLPMWLFVAIFTMANFTIVPGAFYFGHWYRESVIAAAGNRKPQETPSVVGELFTAIEAKLSLFSSAPKNPLPEKRVFPAAARFGLAT
jgi:hypothetical protein